MKIMTFNANGIRSAARKGFFKWLATQDVDIICVQETKAQSWQLHDGVFHPEPYYCFYHDAIKKGYSGTAIYSRHKPLNIELDMGFPLAFDEGRFIRFDYKHFSVISLYMPSGSSGDLRQGLKYEMMAVLKAYLAEYRQQSDKPLIACADWNLCHQNADIHNWRGNKNNSGFLPDERQWLSDLFAAGYCDAFRQLEQAEHEYTWWSNRGQAWVKNVGWRLDYHIVSNSLADKVAASWIYRDERFSDHAPCCIEYQGLVF